MSEGSKITKELAQQFIAWLSERKIIPYVPVGDSNFRGVEAQIIESFFEERCGLVFADKAASARDIYNYLDVAGIAKSYTVYGANHVAWDSDKLKSFANGRFVRAPVERVA